MTEFLPVGSDGLRILYVALGLIFMGLGAVGAFLPVLPTVPFLLVSSFCFARGSPRFHSWFTGTWLYQKHLRSFAEHRAMTLGTKLSILLPVTALLLLTGILVEVTAMRIVLACVIALKYYYFIFRIRTLPRPEKELPLAAKSNKRRVS